MATFPQKTTTPRPDAQQIGRISEIVERHELFEIYPATDVDLRDDEDVRRMAEPMVQRLREALGDLEPEITYSYTPGSRTVRIAAVATVTVGRSVGDDHTLDQANRWAWSARVGHLTALAAGHRLYAASLEHDARLAEWERLREDSRDEAL